MNRKRRLRIWIAGGLALCLILVTALTALLVSIEDDVIRSIVLIFGMTVLYCLAALFGNLLAKIMNGEM